MELKENDWLVNNWLAERETIIKKTLAKKAKKGDLSESWLDCITRSSFKANYAEISRNSEYYGRFVAGEKMRNGHFEFIVEAFEAYFNVECNEFGFIDEDGKTRYNQNFLDFMNARNAGRYINNQSYAQAFREFGIKQAREQFNKFLDQCHVKGDVVITSDVEKYTNEVDYINHVADVLEEKARDCYNYLIEKFGCENEK